MRIEVVVVVIAMIGSVNAMTKKGLRLVEQGIHENGWAVERKRSLSIADSTSAAAKQAKQVADAAAAAASATASGTASKTGTTSSSSTSSGSGSTGGATGTTSSGIAGGSGTATKTATSTTNASMTSGSSGGSSTTTMAASPQNSTTTAATNTTAVKKPANVHSKNTTGTSSNNTSSPADSSSIPTELTTQEDVWDDDAHNASYPLFHYEDIQKATNSSRNWNHSALHDDIDGFVPEAVQKNLSTTKTPFLPAEQKQPEHWPKIVGGIFLGVALVLIAITVVRNIRKSMKRRDYEEVQNLVV